MPCHPRVLGKNCQPQARDNFRLLAGSKLRELIYTQVGYDPTGKKKFDKWHERIELNYQSAPRGFFHVFNEAHTIIYELIMAGAEVGERFVVDISIGQHWSKHWLEHELDGQFGKRSKYPHRYPKSHPQASPIRKSHGAIRSHLSAIIESGSRASTLKAESLRPT